MSGRSPTSGSRPELLDALTALGYEEPTPIQRDAIPPLLAGRDVLGQAATGTGKTAAFALPALQLHRPARRPADPVALVLVPTRELAVQVSEAMLPLRPRARRPGRCRSTAASRSAASSAPCATACTSSSPRRAGRSTTSTAARCSSTAIRLVVLDEADEMLDMGFAEDIESILDATPADRQTVLFSATLPPRINAHRQAPPARPGAHPDRAGGSRRPTPRRSSPSGRSSSRGPTSRPRSGASSTSRRRRRRSCSAARAPRSTS